MGNAITPLSRVKRRNSRKKRAMICSVPAPNTFRMAISFRRWRVADEATAYMPNRETSRQTAASTANSLSPARSEAPRRS